MIITASPQNLMISPPYLATTSISIVKYWLVWVLSCSAFSRALSLVNPEMSANKRVVENLGEPSTERANFSFRGRVVHGVFGTMGRTRCTHSRELGTSGACDGVLRTCANPPAHPTTHLWQVNSCTDVPCSSSF